MGDAGPRRPDRSLRHHGVRQEAERNGRQVVSSQFAPLGTADFGSQITKIRESGANGLFVLESGADAVAFVNQAAQFKLFDDVDTVVTQSMLAEPLFEAMGDTILGWYDRNSYMQAVDDTPKGREFVRAWQQRYDSKLRNVPGENHIGAQVLFEAVRKAGSVELEAVRAVMDGLSLDTIAGPLTIRPEDHQALRDTHVGQIVKGGRRARLGDRRLGVARRDVAAAEPRLQPGDAR